MSYVNIAVVGISALSKFQQGKTAQSMSDTQALQLDYQAKVEQASALQTAALIRRAGNRAQGSSNAAFAASGVQVGAGSALDVERQIGMDVEHDAYQTILDGNRRARGLQTQGEFARIDGSMAGTAANVDAVSTVLGGSYKALRANGWRTAGPGFSGTQPPAPVVERSTRWNYWD